MTIYQPDQINVMNTRAGMPLAERTFAVTIVNDSDETIDSVVIMYSSTTRPERAIPVVCREVRPGEARTLHLGTTKTLRSYGGLLIRGDDVVADAARVRDGTVLSDPDAFVNATAQVLGEMAVDMPADSIG